MRTFANIKSEILVRLGVSTTISYYTDAILNNWIVESNRWATGYKKWPFTEGRVSTTFASGVTDEDGLLRFEYPEGWRADSVRLLTIGGSQLNKKNYYGFRKFLEDNSGSDEKIYSDFGRQIFINPNIDLSGTVTAWGQYTPFLDDSITLTVFSDNEEEGNEAMVYKVMEYAYERDSKLQESITALNKAKDLLETLWQKIQNEQFGYQETDSEGIFKRLDVLGGATRDDLFKRDQFY